MCKYKGENVTGKDFFDLLYQDSDFCKNLGRALLAAGRLESELKLYLDMESIQIKSKNLTFGQLINLLKEHGLLQKMQPALKTLKDQRNYLVHNIHNLLIGLIEETILQREDLLDSDVHSYTEKVWLLEQNLSSIADILEEKRNVHNNHLHRTAGAADV